MDWIIASLSTLLDKQAVCQASRRDKMGVDSDEEEESEDDEDLDHDEMILGNTSDVIISLSKALGDQFLPYLSKLGPKLYQYLGEDHPKSDKVMVIGCLGEVFNNCPAAI